MPAVPDKYVFLPSREVPTTHQPLLEQALKILADDRQAQRTAETGAINRMTTRFSTARRGDAHAILFDYEKAHLNARGDWDKAIIKLRQTRDPQGNGIHVTDFWDAKNNRGTAQIEGQVKGSMAKLGTVFLGDARMTDLRPQPTGLVNKVYVLGRFIYDRAGPKLEADPNHTKMQFVRLPNSDTYVRRYVTRGLNHNDCVNLRNGRDLTAPVLDQTAQRREIASGGQASGHDVSAGGALSEAQQILSHTRGWQKRYISTGVSSRPVFSTRGTQFMSLFGAAVIDLAKLDLSAVFDIHSPVAVQNLLKWDATSVLSAPGPGDGATTLKQEEFLALRDVLRTRELLIKGRVDQRAVLRVGEGQRILGLGLDYKDGPKQQLAAIKKWPGGWSKVRQTDDTNYKGYLDQFWLFLLFDNETTARWFKDNVRGPWQKWQLFERYSMPAI